MTLDDIKDNWCFIEGYEDYIITDHGDIYSYRPDKNETRGFKGLRKMKLKGINNPKRYTSIILSKNNIQKTMQVHRLVGKYFVDGYFDGAVINHIDKDKHNNYYKNLEWVTQTENIHKSYDTMSQVRNYKNWHIEYPDGYISPTLKGGKELTNYIKQNNLPIKMSMLIKHKKHNNFKLTEAV